MIDNKIVGQAISMLRQSENMTQQTLAACLNVSHQAVSKWEKGAALPDVLTLLELSRMFGVTLEQLLSGDIGDRLVKNNLEEPAEEPIELKLDYDDIGVRVEEIVEKAKEATKTPEQTAEEAAKPEHQPENKQEAIDLDKIIEMAPFMSRAALDEIAMNYNDKCSPRQLARLAPFLSKECLEHLVVNCESEINWDTLRRLAPFLRKEAVDALTTACAKGEKYSNDLGRHIKKGLKDVFNFGEKIYHETIKPNMKKVIIVDKPEKDAQQPGAGQPAQDRVSAARSRIFERALAEERFDWIGEHIDQLTDEALKAKIAARALELGKNDWLEEYMDDYCDKESLDNAVLAGNWDYISAHVDRLDEDAVVLIADTAAAEGKWDWLSENLSAIAENDDARAAIIGHALRTGNLDWLGDNLSDMCLNEEDSEVIASHVAARIDLWDWLEAHIDELEGEWACAEYAENAYKAGYRVLASTIVSDHLGLSDLRNLIRLAVEAGDVPFAVDILEFNTESLTDLCCELARGGHIRAAVELAENGMDDAVVPLLEIANELGDWEMIDKLNDMLD